MPKGILHLLLVLSLCSPTLNAQLNTTKISFGDIRARSIGPAVMSGRVSAIDAIDDQSEILYVGAASGGVWKTTNSGASFRPVFDEQILSIGAIDIDQNHTDTVWVGTGEPWVRNSVSIGDGIYVSTNAGRSWTNKGLPNSEHIARVIVHPNNSDVIYVAVQGELWSPNEERGVYRSSDFGTTWEKVLYIDENTGCADISMDPNNPDILYAAMWEHRRSPDFFNSGGESSGLFKSTDGGNTWNELNGGIPEGKKGRIAIALAKTNSDIVYASVETEEKEDKGLYKSIDGGKTFEHINKDFNMTVRPFYFSRMVVDPSDENKLFKCGLNLTISEDGGKTFRTVGSGVHSDMHDVWVDPHNSKLVYLGTDGGMYRSLDGGTYFEHFKNLPLSQFYQISVDNDEPYNVYGGLQDNGSWFAPSRTNYGYIKNSEWKLTYYGDGFYSFRHPTDKDVVYSESQGGNLVRYNKKDGQAKNIKPLEAEGDDEFRFNWNAPIHLGKNNPDRIYFGAQYLFKSDDRGDSWTKISPDLTTNNPERQRQKTSGGLSIDNSTAENNTTIYVICESPKDENIIWAGTDDGYVQVTSNGGKKWNNVTKAMAGLPEGLWVSSIEASNHDANTAYVTVTGHRSGDKTTYVYKTTDLGKSWTLIVDDTVIGFANVIKEDYVNSNLLFLGTEFGFYISIDQGASWKSFKNNIPKHVAVHDLALPVTDDAIVIGTHGRGVYIIDDLAPLRELNEEIISEKLKFFESKPAIVRLQAQGDPFGGAGSFYGENPSDVAQISYYMSKRHTFGKMKMEVYDEEGNFVTELPAGKSKGINVVSLPLRLPRPKAAPTNNRMALFGSAMPPSLTEGKYTVKISKGKEEYSTEIELLNDPTGGYSKEDREVQMKTLMSLYDMTNELGHIYFSLEDLHKQADKISEGQDENLKKQLKDLATSSKKFKDGLVALEGDFYVDEGSNIREEISTLYLNVSFYPGKPSQSQIDKTKYLETQMETLTGEYDGYIEQVKKINEKLAAIGTPGIRIKSFDEYLKP